MTAEFGIPFQEKQKPVNVKFFNKVWVFDYKHKPEKIGDLPENFGEVIPNLIYRGSWPSDVTPLVEKKISKVITLYSSNDKSEVKNLITLRQQISKTNIEHYIFDMVNNETYWQAAELVSNTNKKTYIHCQGGSIRTGVVSFLTQLLYMKKMNQFCDKREFVKLINKTIEYGYNYNNDGYKLLFENIINESCNRELLLKGNF